MSRASEMYQTVVLAHSRYPRGEGPLAEATHQADGYNPICGDRVTMMAKVEGNGVKKVSFNAQSCALCRASASVLVSTLETMDINLAKTKAEDFMDMVLGSGPDLGGDAGAFAAIKNYPARAKCVLLPWRTFVSVLHQPLEGVSKNHAVVSTELHQ